MAAGQLLRESGCVIVSEQPISGYRQLSDDTIVTVNSIKAFERQVGQLWRTIGEGDEVDRRWMALAKTHLQEGFMAFVRAVAKPEDVF